MLSFYYPPGFISGIKILYVLYHPFISIRTIKKQLIGMNCSNDISMFSEMTSFFLAYVLSK